MQLDTRLTSKSDGNWLLCVQFVWIVLCLGLLVRAYLQPNKTVHTNYTKAGWRHWLHGEDTYGLTYDANGKVRQGFASYRYSPLVSAFFVPLAFLSDSWGGVCWRLVNYACYLVALRYFFRFVLPGAKHLSVKHEALWWLLALPLSLPSMNNGQANVLMLAAMLIAAVAVVRERWNLAAAMLAVAFFLKLYPIALCLLFVLAYPRQLIGRLLVAVLIGLALPFAFQHPSYVWGQYANWCTLLVTDQRSDLPISLGYNDFFVLVRFLGYRLSEPTYLVVQLATAGIAAGIVVRGRLAGWSRERLTNAIVLLGCCWMLIFGPATESCTYLLLAPVLAWSLIDAYVMRRPAWSGALLLFVLGMFLSHSVIQWFGADTRRVIGAWLPGGSDFLFVQQPLAALLFFVERCYYLCTVSTAPEQALIEANAEWRIHRYSEAHMASRAQSPVSRDAIAERGARAPLSRRG